MVEVLDPVAAAVAGELRLMDPAVRASRAAAERLLDPGFTEVGASGRLWTRDKMLAELPGMDGGTDRGTGDVTRHQSAGMAGVLLAPDLVHLTYETAVSGRRARRSSLWRRAADGSGTPWRIYYHQATPVPEGM
ncbi:DUF4440 domain-containing protein [Streptomyces sp. TRM49041]|uniref:nuclear transport factor 2 family protein n=1 Tax=Streptomyces sp. TRM49041 TaxID=2603216 RepID=UPI0037D9C066